MSFHHALFKHLLIIYVVFVSLESDLSHVTQQHRIQRDGFSKLQSKNNAAMNVKIKLKVYVTELKNKIKQHEK